MKNILKNWLTFNIKFNKILFKKIELIDELKNNLSFESVKNEKFLNLVKSNYENNPFYNKFYKDNHVDLSVIKDYSDMDKLPILTKKLITENYKKIRTKNKLYFKGYTSGTTGTPLVIYRTFDAIINENAYVWWYRINAGLNINDKKVSIRGDLEKKQIYYLDKYSNTLHISSFALNKTNTTIIYKLISSFKPKALIGYPSSLNTLATLFYKKKYDIEIELTFTSSETLYDFQKNNIKTVFKTKIFDWYGNSERTIALYLKDNNYYEAPMYSVNKYLSNSILTTSLINNAFPLINYKVDDIINTNNIYNLDNKSIIISNIEGRNNSFIELKDGSRVGTAALSLMFKNMSIKNTQIVYYHAGKFDFNIVPYDNFNTESKLKLKKIIKYRLGDKNDFMINIIKEKDVIFNKNGKFIFILKHTKC